MLFISHLGLKYFFSTLNLPGHICESEITTLFLHRQILIHLRHRDQNKQKAPLAYHISLNPPLPY